MGTLLGFRCPQFSEDVAWLPAWLQQHHAEPFDEHIKEGETPLGRWFKEDNVIAEKYVNLSLNEDDRYKTCHLYLSGEDNSAVSFSPSSENLSSDGISGSMPSSTLDVSQTEKLESSNFLLMQQAQTSAGQEEQKNEVKTNVNAGGASLHPLNSLWETSEHIDPQYLACDKDSVGTHEENIKHPISTDCNDESNDAVELSIAASEVLVIHEIAKNGSSQKFLPPGALLEVALRVKQTRLESLEETLHCPTEEIDEVDSLSDLDESTMADAFEDVGLSVTGVDNLGFCDPISQVKDSCASYNHYECDEKYKYGQGAMEISNDDVCMEQRLGHVQEMNMQLRKSFPLESFDGNRANNIVDDPAFGFNTFSDTCHDDPMLQCSFVANSDVPATTESIKFSMGDLTSFQPQPNVNSSSHVWSSENPEKDDQLANAVPDRFQSRWIGGWTWKKDLKISAPMDHNNAKSVPGFWVGEKSYLSESADIAPDENSFVQKQDKGSNMTSQSSIALKDLCNRTAEGILLSQDLVRSSSLSFLDPLCSVVPCSISSPHSTIAPIPNDDVDGEKWFSPVVEHGCENMEGTSSLNVEFIYGKEKAVPNINGEGSRSTVCRQLASLRTYSMLIPRCDAFRETGNVYPNRSFKLNCMGLLSSEQNMGCKRVSSGSPSFKSILKCTSARRVEENHENPVTDLAKQKIFHDETEKDGAELQVCMQKGRNSPYMLKGGTCCQFQDSKHILQGFGEEENAEWTKVPESNFWILQRKSIRNMQSKRKIPRGKEISARKKVRFCDTDIRLMQKKNLQKLQHTPRKCSTTRSGKKLIYSHSKFRDQEVKRGQTKCPSKDGQMMIFQDMEFLLTGFSSQKEKEVKGLIRKYGGTVLSDIPPPNSRGKRRSKLNHQQLPVVLCVKKLHTAEFLYGCAVNAAILNVNWLTDSIAVGSVLPPEKYVILPRHAGEIFTGTGKLLCRNNHHRIFDRVGIMLHGNPIFCIRFAKIVKHGGGQVFKTLQWLVKSLDSEKISVGIIVAEDDSGASRHLKHCAAERKIPMMPVSWIINSLHAGEVLPSKENNQSSPSPIIKVPVSMEFSEEI